MDNSTETIRKLIKPKLSIGILFTLICLAPFINLLCELISSQYNNILLYAILSFFTLTLLGAYWCWHIMKMINLEQDIEEIKKTMEE